MKTKKQLKWKKPEVIRSLSEEEVYNEIRNDDLQVRGGSWLDKLHKDASKPYMDSYPDGKPHA